MSAAFVHHGPAMLPWTDSEEDERRFRRILKRVLLVCLLFSLIMPWLPVPKVDRSKVEELPPRLAKLLLERQPAPPPVVAPSRKPEPEVAAAKPKPEVTKPEPAKPPVTEARKPDPAKAPGERLAAARRKASGVGLLAMKDELADLRGAPVAAQFQKDIKPGPGVGSGSGPGVGAGRSPGLPSRSLITSNATGGSGGGGTLRRGGSGKASRSIEDIKLVFDRNKGSIYTLYNRALREDPTLQGKVVVKLTIAPSGQVLDCQLVSSELRAPDLERKVLLRIKQFDFGAKAVDAMVVTYPIDFLPS